jgi:Flp pilus assembly protein TadG
MFAARSFVEVSATMQGLIPSGGRPRAEKRTIEAQATVEFALCLTVFLMIVFGTVDFGRELFLKSELDNAVREGARYGKIHPTSTSGVQAKVVGSASDTGLTTNGVTVSCGGGCATGDTMTVSATVSFSAITQRLLGLSSFPLTARAVVNIE